MIRQPINICRRYVPSFLKLFGEAIYQRLRPLLQTIEINGFHFFSNWSQVAERSQHEEYFFLVERVTNTVEKLKELLKKGSILLKHILLPFVLQVSFAFLNKNVKDADSLIFLESLQAGHHV